jgi:putative nucleotidyltransferase with HDIG domain
MSWKVRLYVSLICLGAVYLIVSVSVGFDLREYLVALILLTVASFLAQVYELEVVAGWGLSTQLAIGLAAVFIGGIPLGLWVIALSTLPAELIVRRYKLDEGVEHFLAPVLFNAGQMALSVAAAAVVFNVSVELLPEMRHPFHAMALSSVGYVLVNCTLVAAVVALSSGERFFHTLRVFLKTLHLQFATLGILAMLMAILYADSPVSLMLAFVPLALVHYATRNFLKLRRESHLAFKQITDLLAERDEYTGTHSDDVENLTVKLAEAMRLSDEEIEAVRAGAAIHDIGKIAIPDAILKKPGALNDREFEVMKTHTIIGAEILQNLDVYKMVVPIVRHEHEHWDGDGYPDGLAGESIPVGARIVAVADVYSALTTERGYRPPQGKPLRYSPEEAFRILREMAGHVLDPKLVEAFIDLVERGRMSERAW